MDKRRGSAFQAARAREDWEDGKYDDVESRLWALLDCLAVEEHDAKESTQALQGARTYARQALTAMLRGDATKAGQNIQRVVLSPWIAPFLRES